MSYPKAYHYTIFQAVKGILDDERIRLSKDIFTPAVWFSRNPRFDPGSGTVAQNRKEVTWEMLTQKIGLARFSTDAGLLTPYPDAVRNGLVLTFADMKNRLAMSQRGGDTEEWLIHYGTDFPLRLCTGADLYLRGAWRKMTPETIAEMGELLPRTFGATCEDLFG